jgi:hypothetical protein
MNIIFQYLDGSNNHYKITPDALVFEPMKPEFSSSGEYDGGEAKTVALTESEFNEVRQVMMAGFEAVSEHIVNRSKGTALLKMQEDNERASCLLDMNSAFKNNIEIVLKGLLSK